MYVGMYVCSAEVADDSGFTKVEEWTSVDVVVVELLMKVMVMPIMMTSWT